MLEFWDTSEEHKNDILNFMDVRKTPSDYCDGRYTYWIGLADGAPFSLIMAIIEYPGEDRPQLKEEFISKTGSTYGLDFCIGNKYFHGQGLAAPTIKAFTEFFKAEVDKEVDTFMIDPYDHNPRAKHVYAKAGFELVGDFIMQGTLTDSDGKRAFLLVKKM